MDDGIVEEFAFWSIDTAWRPDHVYERRGRPHRGQLDYPGHLFRNLRAPQGQLAGPPILMWNGVDQHLVDGNTFMDRHPRYRARADRADANDHTGGIVRNNFIDRHVAGDSAIDVVDRPEPKCCTTPS